MTAAAEANKQLILDYFDAWARGDVTHAESYWADDFVGFQAGHGTLAGYWPTFTTGGSHARSS